MSNLNPLYEFDARYRFDQANELFGVGQELMGTEFGQKALAWGANKWQNFQQRRAAKKQQMMRQRMANQQGQPLSPQEQFEEMRAQNQNIIANNAEPQ